MNIKAYFEKDMVMNLIFAVAGVFAGYASFVANSSAFAFMIMVVMGAAMVLVFRSAMKITEGFKWWLGNGLGLYLLVWLVVWTLFYNLALR